MQYLIKKRDSGKRLDIFLSLSDLEISRSKIKELIGSGGVVVSGKKPKPSYILKEGDLVFVDVLKEETPETENKPEDIPLNIVYEDEDILVVNKNRGMVVHPACGNYSGTLVNALLFHCKKLSSGGESFRPGIVHRLDKDTSGLIVVAKNDKAHADLSWQFKNHKVEKKYIAILKGALPYDDGIISEPIGRHPVNRKKMAVADKTKRSLMKSARDALTFYKVIERFKKCTFVEVLIKTGRTHQIRVHMNHIGFPILGDEVYGGKNDLGVKKPMLHSYRLKIIHPKTKEYMQFEAEIPKDMKTVLNKLKNDK